MAVTRHTSQRITLLMLVLASVTILTLDYHGEANRAITHVRNAVADGLSPFQRGISAVLHPIGDSVSAMFHYGELENDNARLQAELGTVDRQLAATRYATSVEQDVTFSSLAFAGNIKNIPAEVITPATSNFESTIEIDRGTDDGVGVGEPVVGNAGLVGTIESAGSHTAEVQLITDTRSSIEVEDTSNGNVFQLQGGGRQHSLSLSSYGTTALPAKGATLDTAGQANGSSESYFPAGIPVGSVSSVESSASGSTVNGSVAPLVDTSTLQYVAVLQWLPPA